MSRKRTRRKSTEETTVAMDVEQEQAMDVETEEEKPVEHSVLSAASQYFPSLPRAARVAVEVSNVPPGQPQPKERKQVPAEPPQTMSAAALAAAGFSYAFEKSRSRQVAREALLYGIALTGKAC